MSDEKPFSPNGDGNGTVLPSVSAPGLPPAASADTNVSAVGNVPSTPVDVPRASHVCRCGATAHASQPDICARGHALPGNRRTVKHGLHSERFGVTDTEHVPDADDVHGAGYTDRYADLLRRHVNRLSRFLDGHPPRLADLPHVERLLVLAEKVKAFEEREQRTVPCGASTKDGEAPADWPTRLALHFANTPDEFGGFIVQLLQADHERVGPLRQQVRMVLDALEPEGKPVWRADPAVADEVLL